MRTLLPFLLLPSAAWSADLAVPSDYDTITDAISAAIAGDRIVVAPGTYDERLFIDRSLTVIAPDGGVTVRTSDALGQASDALIEVASGISATFNGVVLTSTTHRAIYAAAGSSVALVDVQANGFETDDDGAVIFAVSASVSLEGVVFNSNRATNGGAISISGVPGATASLSVTDSTLTANVANNAGGHVSASGPVLLTIVDSTFTGGNAFAGGALHLSGLLANATLTDNTFSNNTANSHGGAITAVASDVILDVTGSRLTGNVAGQSGGAVYLDRSRNLRANDSIIARNQAEDGGAVAFLDSRRLELFRTIVCGNTALNNGGAVWVTGLIGRAELVNTTFFANAATADGGAIWAHDAATLNLTFTTLLDNTSSQGDQVRGLLIGNLIARNTTFAGALSPALRIDGSLITSDIAYNLWDVPEPVLGGSALSALTLAETNLFEPAVFNLVQPTPCESSQLWPRFDSPAVDAGDPGRSDPDGTRADIGAYGGPDSDPAPHADNDGDGFSIIRDCDDTQSDTYPNAPEDCNGRDNDCNGLIDDDPVTPRWYLDLDGDGFGDALDAGVGSCTSPGEGYVTNNLDCDDDNDAVNPDAAEVCNDIDDNCDGLIDGNAIDQVIYYRDNDGDGFGRDLFEVRACAQPAGYALVGGDCDDARDTVYPGAPEFCNGRDNDCNGIIDDNAVDGTAWYPDADGDGYGAGEGTSGSCTPPGPGFTQQPGDCDDTNRAVNPGALEICDGIDNNCDGTIDINPVDRVWYPDADQDGSGDNDAAGIAQCDDPGGGLVLSAGDCDDNDAAIGPHADEVCDGIDNNCDGTIDGPNALDATTYYFDADRDGFGAANRPTQACAQPPLHVADNTDCNDNNAQIYPGAPETCNGLDDDCDGKIDNDYAIDAPAWYRDSDGDNWGDATATVNACNAPPDYIALDGDCDDADPAVNPAAVEVCDGVDNNCNGIIDEPEAIDAPTWFLDDDGDGFGDARYTVRACEAPEGYVDNSRDCDDSDPAINPDAEEIPNNLIDENCDGIAEQIPELPEEETGCGCSAAPSAPTGFVFSLVGLLGLLARRRR